MMLKFTGLSKLYSFMHGFSLFFSGGFSRPQKASSIDGDPNLELYHSLLVKIRDIPPYAEFIDVGLTLEFEY